MKLFWGLPILWASTLHCHFFCSFYLPQQPIQKLVWAQIVPMQHFQTHSDSSTPCQYAWQSWEMFFFWVQTETWGDSIGKQLTEKSQNWTRHRKLQMCFTHQENENHWPLINIVYVFSRFLPKPASVVAQWCGHEITVICRGAMLQVASF